MDIWLLVAGIGVVVWYWLDSLRSRELAILKCRSFCRENGVQLLDQSVHSKQVRLARLNGVIALRRFYAFDFSLDGSDRYHGVAVVCGKLVEYLSLLHPEGEIIYGQSRSKEGLHSIQ